MMRAIAYGLFPGVFRKTTRGRHDFDWPELYNRDRALFKKYVPICRTISEAGWRPVNRVLDVGDDRVFLEQFGPEVARQGDLPEWIWYRIRQGMRQVITDNEFFENYPVAVYGKTGTAEESKTRPNHALFVGYSHLEGFEDIAFATRIANGYSSTNALLTTKDMLDYYYHVTDDVLTGESATEGLSSTVTD